MGLIEKSSLRVAVATYDNPTETFIQAHLERLPFDVMHISRGARRYSDGGVPIRKLLGLDHPSFTERICKLLPEVVSFRVRRRLFRSIGEDELITRYLRQENTAVVLAEYGMIGAYFASVCSNAGIPLVVHFHGADATRRDFLNEFKSGYTEMFRIAKACIAVSEKMRCDLISLGCPSEKVALCPYGPNEDYLLCNPDFESNQLIAVGRLTPKKAPHLTLLAFARALRTVPDLQLVMIGDGELRGVCEDLIVSLGLSAKVKMCGTRTPVEIREEIARSFAFIQHSVHAWDGDCEGTPVAILEACAAGLPVISTRHAGIPDTVKHGETGILVGERDVAAMAEAIVAYASDRKLARLHGSCAREYVCSNLSLERHLSQLSRLLVESARKKSVC